MTSLAGFFIGVGMFLGLACIGHGLICMAHAIRARREQ